MFKRRIPLHWSVLFFFLSYTPYAVTVKVLIHLDEPSLGRPMTGLEFLPFTLVVSSIFLLGFVWFTGWWRIVPHRFVGGLPIFKIRPWMWFGSIGATMLLICVPLTYTFKDVSIPLIHLLMRGDVLIIAPIIDMLFGRRVGWYSWVAIGIVGFGLVLNFMERSIGSLPIGVFIIMIIYTIGFLMRLAAMTKIAKNDDVNSMKLFFVEERLVSIPMTLGLLGLYAWLSNSIEAQQLAWGFTSVWTSSLLPQLMILAVCLVLITFLTVMILADKHENSYCVPLERSAAVLAGLAASWILYQFFGQRPISNEEIYGALLLIGAIVILAIGPMIDKVRLKKRALLEN